MDAKTIEEGKQTAMIAYFTIIGLVIAYYMNMEPKNKFATIHIRQALGLYIVFFTIAILVGFFNSWMISGPFYVFFVVLWVFGLVNAMQGEYRPVPLLGDYFQDWFKSI
jgi:uncharacterized membrane protein